MYFSNQQWHHQQNKRGKCVDMMPSDVITTSMSLCDNIREKKTCGYHAQWCHHHLESMSQRNVICLYHLVAATLYVTSKWLQLKKTVLPSSWQARQQISSLLGRSTQNNSSVCYKYWILLYIRPFPTTRNYRQPLLEWTLFIIWTFYQDLTKTWRKTVMREEGSTCHFMNTRPMWGM